jgi:hypothetical protein
MINLLKKYLYISLGLHIFIFTVILIVSSGSNIKQPFVVFGAYSKKDYHTFYKAKKSIIPFMRHGSVNNFAPKNHGSRSGNAGAGHNNLGKAIKSGATKTSKITEKSKSVKSRNLGDSKQGKRSGKKAKVSSKKTLSGKKQLAKPITEPRGKEELAKNKKEKQRELAEEKAFAEELKKIEIEEQKQIDKEIKEKAKKEKDKKDLLVAQQRAAEKIKKLEEIEALKEKDREEVESEQQMQEISEDKDDLNDSQDAQSEEDFQVGQDVQPEGGNLAEGQDDIGQEEFVFTLGDLCESQAAYSRHIQSEIGRLWKPPLGVLKGTTCKIKFTISQDGEVENFDIIKKSNVIIYDLSILRVAHLFKFDKCLWGKSFMIDFRQ